MPDSIKHDNNDSAIKQSPHSFFARSEINANIEQDTARQQQISDQDIQQASSLLDSAIKLIRYAESSTVIRIMAGLLVLSSFIALGAALAIVTPMVSFPLKTNDTDKIDNNTLVRQIVPTPVAASSPKAYTPEDLKNINTLTQFIYESSNPSPEIIALRKKLLAADPASFIEVSSLPTLPADSSIPSHDVKEHLHNGHRRNKGPLAVADILSLAVEKTAISSMESMDNIRVYEPTKEENKEIIAAAEDLPLPIESPTITLIESTRNELTSRQAFKIELDALFFELKSVMSELAKFKLVRDNNPHQSFVNELELLNTFDETVIATSHKLIRLRQAQTTRPLTKKNVTSLLKMVNLEISNTLDTLYFEKLISARHAPLFCHLATHPKLSEATLRAIQAWKNLITPIGNDLKSVSPHLLSGNVKNVNIHAQKTNDIKDFLASTIRYLATQPDKYEQLQFLFAGYENVVIAEIEKINAFDLTMSISPIADLDEIKGIEFNTAWIITEDALTKTLLNLQKSLGTLTEEDYFSSVIQVIPFNTNLALEYLSRCRSIWQKPENLQLVVNAFSEQPQNWTALLFEYLFSINAQPPVYNSHGVLVYQHEANAIFKPLFEGLIKNQKYLNFFGSNLHYIKWRSDNSMPSATTIEQDTAMIASSEDNDAFTENTLCDIVMSSVVLGIGCTTLFVLFLPQLKNDPVETVKKIFTGLPVEVKESYNNISIALEYKNKHCEITPPVGKIFYLRENKVEKIITQFIESEKLSLRKFEFDLNLLRNLSSKEISDLNQKLLQKCIEESLVNKPNAHLTTLSIKASKTEKSKHGNAENLPREGGNPACMSVADKACASRHNEENEKGKEPAAMNWPFFDSVRNIFKNNKLGSAEPYSSAKSPILK